MISALRLANIREDGFQISSCALPRFDVLRSLRLTVGISLTTKYIGRSAPITKCDCLKLLRMGLPFISTKASPDWKSASQYFTINPCLCPLTQASLICQNSLSESSPFSRGGEVWGRPLAASKEVLFPLKRQSMYCKGSRCWWHYHGDATSRGWQMVGAIHHLVLRILSGGTIP